MMQQTPVFSKICGAGTVSDVETLNVNFFQIPKE